MARQDPHSWCDDSQPRTRELLWKARVDFDQKVLEGEATLVLDKPSGGLLDLDSRELRIDEVRDQKGQQLTFVVEPPDKVLGSRVRVTLGAGTEQVRIRYRTSKDASALQWLAPAETAGGKEPYLFTQCQAIHARSVVPVQDSPSVRITFKAELTFPKRLRAVMAAAFDARSEQGPWATERWHMPQPIPPYLFAFAVGDLASKDLGPRSRVWAEPSVLERAAWEFAGVEAMIDAAEKLFGPYDWDRFDILTMPPSFPYGGMENPRLTFLTPTVLAGDRSLVNVVAHELAHSWTGNLVTNANAEHFWLNEGFTVYAERRILEALEGTEVAALHAALGRRSLEQAVEHMKATPELTRLRTHLEGVDPDEAFSQVPYEKGYLFLRTLEEAAGRDRFGAVLRQWLQGHRFGSVTTDDFTAFLEQALPGVLAKAQAPRWLDQAGIPDNAPAPRSAKLEAIQALGGRFPGDAARAWTPTEWQLYLESVPTPAPRELCDPLEQAFGLTRSTNYEVLVSWLTLAAKSQVQSVLPRIEEVLGTVGRMKYLKPLYLALATSEQNRAFARSTFERLKARYHPIARQVVESLLKQSGA